MTSYVNIDTSILKADITKFAKTYCEAVQNLAVEEATTLAKAAMESYYGAYEPFYYDPRTNQMKEKSFKSYKEKIGNSYRGGIEINSDFTNHQPKGVEESDIYNFVWEEGIHGFEYFRTGDKHNRQPIYGKGEPKNRYDEIDRKLHSPSKKREISEKAMATAKRGAYTMLRF